LGRLSFKRVWPMKARTDNLPSVFQRYRADIDAELRAVLSGRDSPLYHMLRYHLGWVDERGNPLAQDAGKALRPTLCLLACEAAGGHYQKALPAAAALELIHNFSLIHDDIQDGDRERRHRPTVWYLWGKNQALNAGDSMHALANLALCRLKEKGVAAPKQVQALRLLTEGCLAMIEGQYLDLSYESRLDVSVDDYLEMVSLKTAALIGCATGMGALLGTDDELLIEHLRRFGHRLGLAFQIRDDILGIWGDETITGKPLASDIRRKKKSLPVVYALASQDRELLRIYRKPSLTEAEVALVLNKLEAKTAQAQAEAFCQQALDELEGIELKPQAREELVELAHFLTQRSY